jgi:hypothetical protein
MIAGTFAGLEATRLSGGGDGDGANASDAATGSQFDLRATATVQHLLKRLPSVF